MTLRELRIFLTICEARTISKAALKLGISQPGLSRTIRDMEKRSELRFFERNGRGVDLTPAGQILRKHAEIVLNTIEDLQLRLDELREDIRGSVVVLLPTHVSQVVTPDLVKTFAATYPKATIHVFEDNNARIVSRIEAGEADIGLHYATTDAVSNRSEIIATEDLYLVGLPSEIGDANSGPIDFSEISGMPLVLPRPKAPYRQFLETSAARSHVDLNVVRELEMSSTMLAFVLEREGATILPFSHFHGELRDGLVSARLIERPRIRRWMRVIRSASSPNKVIQFSIDALKEHARQRNDMLSWNFVN